jgi:hypothetical protein
MNVEIGAEAALFPEKEYINGIAVAVHLKRYFKKQVISFLKFCNVSSVSFVLLLKNEQI